MITINLPKSPVATDKRHDELEPGYYRVRYAGREYLVLVAGQDSGKMAISLEDPEDLYWTVPFRLRVISQVTDLTITVA